MSENIAVACIKSIGKIAVAQIENEDEEGAIKSIDAIMKIVEVK